MKKSKKTLNYKKKRKSIIKGGENSLKYISYSGMVFKNCMSDGYTYILENSIIRKKLIDKDNMVYINETKGLHLDKGYMEMINNIKNKTLNTKYFLDNLNKCVELNKTQNLTGYSKDNELKNLNNNINIYESITNMDIDKKKIMHDLVYMFDDKEINDINNNMNEPHFIYYMIGYYVTSILSKEDLKDLNEEYNYNIPNIDEELKIYEDEWLWFEYNFAEKMDELEEKIKILINFINNNCYRKELHIVLNSKKLTPKYL